MEHISNHLQKIQTEIQKPQEQNSSLQVLKKTFSEEENKVIELKYRSKRINSLSDVELLLHCKKLLLQIHVITGWPIPSTEEMMNIFLDQFIKNIQEKFPELNVHEIEYAFRKNGTIIPDWGKQMNLSLIDAVLIPYVNERFLISQDEEKVKEKPVEQKIFTQQELDDYSRESCEWQYQLFLKGQPITNIESNFEILKKDGVIKDGETVAELFSRRMEKQIFNIYKKQ